MILEQEILDLRRRIERLAIPKATGTVTLVSGAATVKCGFVTSASRILLTHQNTSGSMGTLYVGTRTGGVSFQILSSNGGDTANVAWALY